MPSISESHCKKQAQIHHRPKQCFKTASRIAEIVQDRDDMVLIQWNKRHQEHKGAVAVVTDTRTTIHSNLHHVP